MGLMTGSGPLGRQPAGRFNFDPPRPGQAVYLEPTPKRIRVVVAGETIADSRHAMLLHESGHQPIYYFPPEDVRSEFLEPSDRHTRCPKKGDASYFTIRVGDHVVDAGAWYYPEPIEAAPPPLRDLVAFYWNRMDRWLEEDEVVFGHPRDPYHRIDTISTHRHIRISLDGKRLAETTHAVALFESNLPPRWYLPRDDVRVALQDSDTHTHCPYKGEASYFSVELASGEVGRDLVWYYPDPLPDALRVAGLLCFYSERVDVELDGELQERPETPWSQRGKGNGDRAQNAAPVQTRG